MLQRCADLGLLQLGIAECGSDISMSKNTLDDFHALTLRDQISAARMAQLVWCVTGSTQGIQQPSRSADLGPLVVQRVV
jgi:hypothetical protein